MLLYRSITTLFWVIQSYGNIIIMLISVKKHNNYAFSQNHNIDASLQKHYFHAFVCNCNTYASILLIYLYASIMLQFFIFLYKTIMFSYGAIQTHRSIIITLISVNNHDNYAFAWKHNNYATLWKHICYSSKCKHNN